MRLTLREERGGERRGGRQRGGEGETGKEREAKIFFLVSQSLRGTSLAVV